MLLATDRFKSKGKADKEAILPSLNRKLAISCWLVLPNTCITPLLTPSAEQKLYHMPHAEAQNTTESELKSKSKTCTMGEPMTNGEKPKSQFLEVLTILPLTPVLSS